MATGSGALATEPWLVDTWSGVALARPGRLDLEVGENGDISGSGSATIRVERDIESRTDGSGPIVYSGQADISVRAPAQAASSRHPASTHRAFHG